MSNITVSVDWEQPTAFAGEEIRCAITFRNEATPLHSRSPSPNSQLRVNSYGRTRWKLGLQRQSVGVNSPSLSRYSEPQPIRPRNQSHRSAISLSAPVGSSREDEKPHESTKANGQAQKHRHNRSVSIISISSQSGVNGDHGSLPSKQMRSVQRNHVRSASFQGLPIRNGSQNTSGASSPLHLNTMSPNSHRSSTIPLPLQRVSTSRHPSRMRTDSSSNNRSLSAKMPTKHRRSSSDFIGLGIQGHPTVLNPESNGESATNPNSKARGEHETPPKELPTNRSLQRVISPGSIDGASRSSFDFYAHSNNSSETLASEYISSANQSQSTWSTHFQPTSRVAPTNTSTKRPDTLMMGYVQLLGSFTLDGSLVSMAPFEEIKRKGVIGGQGSGGVVGVEHASRENGIFGSLGWGNIGQSLGGLLGQQEPSSIREMKGIASSKSIPILSTPQSILFVDLKLKPGDSKTFLYSHALPTGIPPTHKGRVMKSSYQLLIGTQRAKSLDRQHLVKQVEVPFRVLPSVDSAGEILGHDLFNPYVLLKDLSFTKALSSERIEVGSERKKIATEDSSFEEFALYVNSCLQRSRQSSNMSLLSPTEHPSSAMSYERKMTVKERIDSAIFQGPVSGQSKKNSNRFQIHRDGVKVATVILGRSSYRLGETVSSIVDFSNSDSACLAINVTLETTEIVDPAIALRSATSIHRATRRVHASCYENTISAQRVLFNTVIPLNATPEFITSGIRLEWKLKFEFITENHSGMNTKVLETVAEDERGKVAAAIHELHCRSFDAAVPIKVYGSVKEFGEDFKPAIFSI